MFHLHDSTTSHLLYSKVKDGGLGFPRLGDQLLLAYIGQGIKILRGEVDAAVHRLENINDLEGRLAQLCFQRDLEWPNTLAEMAAYKRGLAKDETDQWASLVSQSVKGLV